MQSFIKYRELRKGDVFLIDPYSSCRDKGDLDHCIGMVLEDVKPGTGTPCVVTVKFREIVVDRRKKPREFDMWRNAEHVTKYIRPGEYDTKINMGRG